jgi:hypothetical protein
MAELAIDARRTSPIARTAFTRRIRSAEGPTAFNQIRRESGSDVSISLREPFSCESPTKAKLGSKEGAPSVCE